MKRTANPRWQDALPLADDVIAQGRLFVITSSMELEHLSVPPVARVALGLGISFAARCLKAT
jgi:hypothetical protein